MYKFTAHPMDTNSISLFSNNFLSNIQLFIEWFVIQLFLSFSCSSGTPLAWRGKEESVQ